MKISLSLMTLMAGVCPAVAGAQGLAVEHAEVGCLVAQRFPVLSARIDPADRVARARVYFRAEAKPYWYFVEMKLLDGVFKGTLPRPRKDTARIQYYIEALDTAAASTRTPDYTPSVAASAAECSKATAVAGATGAGAVVAVGAPTGAPIVPAGFEASGIVAAGAAGATVAATAVAAGAGGGGIGTTALVVGGVVVAGGAAAAVATGAAGGGNGDGGNDGEGRAEQCGTVRISDRTATTLTVTWSGGQPTDGKYIVDVGVVAAGSACTVLSHERSSIVIQATSFVITGLSPATTYSVHVHPAGTPCPNCDTGYNITDTVGAAVATTLGQ